MGIIRQRRRRDHSTPTAPRAPVALDWRIDGTLAAVPMRKARRSDGLIHQPTRPLAGWAMTYAQIASDGSLVETNDRDGQVMQAARGLGAVDWSAYIEHGLWNDTHKPVFVGVPTFLDYCGQRQDGTLHPLAKAHRKVGFYTAGHLFDRADPQSWTRYAPARPHDQNGFDVRDGDPQLTPTDEELDRADHFWHVASLLKGSGRPLGFSAQGTMLMSPCKTRIIAAAVSQEAVCELPVNPDCTAEVTDQRLLKGAGTPISALMKARRGFTDRPCGRCDCPDKGECGLYLGGRALPFGKATSAQLAGVKPQSLEGSRAHLGAYLDQGETREFIRSWLMSKFFLSPQDADAWIDAYLKQLT